jgi:hypothetical protein
MTPNTCKWPYRIYTLTTRCVKIATTERDLDLDAHVLLSPVSPLGPDEDCIEARALAMLLHLLHGGTGIYTRIEIDKGVKHTYTWKRKT